MVYRQRGAVGQVQVATSCVPQVWRVKSPAVLQGQLPGTCAGPFLPASCTARLWGEDRVIWSSRSRFAQVRDADMFVVLGEAGCVWQCVGGLLYPPYLWPRTGLPHPLVGCMCVGTVQRKGCRLLLVLVSRKLALNFLGKKNSTINILKLINPVGASKNTAYWEEKVGSVWKRGSVLSRRPVACWYVSALMNKNCCSSYRSSSHLSWSLPPWLGISQ